MRASQKLNGKTIERVEYDNQWKEKVLITFTDGTVAMIYPYMVGEDGNEWPAMTITIIEEIE